MFIISGVYAHTFIGVGQGTPIKRVLNSRTVQISKVITLVKLLHQK